MNYHNPEQITEWGQSDGWRLLTTEEIKQPLPDDAEIRCADGRWAASGCRGAEGAGEVCTYRTKKPLPVSPLIAKLDAEIKARQELRDIALAVEAGVEWEIKLVNGFQDWHKGDYEFDWYVSGLNGNWQVRLKPKPVTRPWSFETRPRGVVWVFKKGFITDRMITAWRDDGVEIGEYEKPSYQELFDNWLQRDGSICGETTEEAK